MWSRTSPTDGRIGSDASWASYGAELAGAVAFSVATAGLGSVVAGATVGAALGAGVYSVAQTGTEQASEKSQGLRQQIDFSAILEQGASEAVMTFVGALVGDALSKLFLRQIGTTLAKRLSLSELQAVAAKAGYAQFGPELFVNKGWAFVADLAGGMGTTAPNTQFTIIDKFIDGDTIYIKMEES